MRLIYLRHGERVRGGKDGALTDHGCQQATLAGTWLRERGHQPTHLQTTPTIRTIRTGGLAIAQAMPSGCVLLRPRNGMADTPPRWDRLVAELAKRLGPDATVLLVGHEATQSFIERTWAQDRRAPQRNHCAAFVLEGEPGGDWQCLDAFGGVEDLPASPKSERAQVLLGVP